MSIRDDIRKKITLSEGGDYHIVRSEEELAEIQGRNIDNYDLEVEDTDSAGYVMENIANLGELLSSNSGKNHSGFVDNRTILTDYVRIGDNTYNIAPLKANNHYANLVKDGTLQAFSCILNISRSNAASIDLGIGGVVQALPKLSRSETTKIDEKNCLTQVQGEGSQRVNFLHAGNIQDIEYFNLIAEAVVNLKARIMIDTLKSCRKEDFRSQIFVTNNRHIRNIVDNMITAHYGEIDDLVKRELINDIMASLNSQLNIHSLGDARMSIGVQVIDISRSKDFKWESAKGDRGYKRHEDFYQRSIYLNDSYSTIPVLAPRINDYLKEYQVITERFINWANNEVMGIIGKEKKSLARMNFKKVEQQKINEVMGISDDEADNMVRELQKEIVQKTEAIIKMKAVNQ